MSFMCMPVHTSAHKYKVYVSPKAKSWLTENTMNAAADAAHPPPQI